MRDRLSSGCRLLCIRRENYRKYLAMHFRAEYLFVVFHLGTLFLTSKGQTITYDVEVNKKGSQSLWRGFKTVSTVQACQQFCTESDGCVAGEFHTAGSSCYLYRERTALTPADGITFSWKIETETTPETTTETTTTQPTTTTLPTTTSPPTTESTTPTTTIAPFVGCSMSRSNSVTNDSPFMTLPFTAEYCQTACLYISECSAITFIGGTCNLYKQTTSTSSPSSIVYVKGICSNGTRCCMTSTSTETVTSTSALLTVAASVEGCELLCRLVTECTATNYQSFDNSCAFYTKNPTIRYNDSGIHSVKACQPGQSNGLFHFTGNCRGDTENTAAIVFIDPLVFLVTYTVICGIFT